MVPVVLFAGGESRTGLRAVIADFWRACAAQRNHQESFCHVQSDVPGALLGAVAAVTVSAVAAGASRSCNSSGCCGRAERALSISVPAHESNGQVCSA